MLERVGFGRYRIVKAQPAPLRPAARIGVYGGSTTQPAPKSKPYRDPALLEMARGRPCLLLIAGPWAHPTDTVVAAHSNLLIHGKGRGRKADDCYSVAACVHCHSWLDTGPASAQEKAAAFADGHARQRQAWRNIATASDEPERCRRAAQRALEHLEATGQ